MIETEAEPEGWEIDCLAPTDDAYFSGAPGLWSMSKGAKYWDDLEVIELDESKLPRWHAGARGHGGGLHCHVLRARARSYLIHFVR